MSSYYFVVASLIFSCALVPLNAFAAPYELSYGGRLTEGSGKPVAGPVNMRVTFFRSLTGNDQVAVAIPDLTGVTLQEGIFQIALSLSAADFHIAFNGTDATYIQIEDISHGVTYPRQKFSAVPYALKVPVDRESITYNSEGELALGNGANILKLPNASGAANKVLKSNGAGALVWADDLSGGGAGTITGTEIQDGAIANDDISATAAIATSKISGLGSLATKSAVGSSDITDSSVTGTDIANGTITDANINATAAISYLKISGLGSAATKSVGTTASDVAAGSHTHTMSAVTDAGSLATKNAVGSADIADGSVTGADIAGGTITDGNISATAAIANSKIAGLGNAATKNVGATASDVAAGNHSHADATTGASGFMSGADKVRLNAAVVTTDTGTVSNTMLADSAVTNAKINNGAVDANKLADGSVSLAKLSATICSANQILKMNSAGTALTCATDLGGAGAVQSVSENQAIATSDHGKAFLITGSPTLTLPAAAAAGSGFLVHFKQVSGTGASISAQSGETIDGNQIAAIAQKTYGFGSLLSDGTQWLVLNAKNFTQGFRYYRFVISSTRGAGTSAVTAIEKLQFRIDGSWQTQSFSTSAGTIGAYSGVVASSSSNYGGYSAFSAFDPGLGDTAVWISGPNTFSTSSPYDSLSSTWVKVDFGAGNAPLVEGLRVLGQVNASVSDRSPDVFELQGSNDGSSWITVPGSSKTGIDTRSEYEYIFN